MLQIGEEAPDFTVARDGGGQVTLSGLRGRKVVLYFYPKDDTPGCTTEACDFRDAMPDFSGISAEIVGISRDSVAKHERFRAKHGLPFALGADVEGDVCEAYGTWVEKSMYGRTYMGIERSTFLIDENGIIRHIWRKVRPRGHVSQVLETARALGESKNPA